MPVSSVPPACSLMITLLMWGALLYRFCFYWLVNKATSAYGREEHNHNGRDIERVDRVKEISYSCEGDRYLTGRPQPQDKPQNNRNGLI